MVRRLGLIASLAFSAAACGSTARSPDEGSSTTIAPSEPASNVTPPSPASPGDAPDARRVEYRQFDINHVLSTGQGNAVAIDATPPITVAQPYGNLKFDTGVIPARQCDAFGCKAYAKPSRFVPLIEGDHFFRYGVETMSSGLANQAAKLADAMFLTHDVLVTLHGRSENTYACLRKDGCEVAGAPQGYVPPFADAMLQVHDAMAIAKASGKSYVVRAVTAIHGESDHLSYVSGPPQFPMGTVASYGDAMIEWQKDYETAVQAITGQTLPVPLMLLQMSNWSDASHSPIPGFVLAAHVDAPGKVIVVTPGYAIGYADDCIHFTNHGERRVGEYFGKAYARVVLEGKTWEPLRPVDVTLSGQVITAKFIVPRPPLVLDTEHVTNPGDYGFEFSDDSGAPPAIASVALAGPDAVQITLAAAPVGNDRRLRYAHTASPEGCAGFARGPRGNLRDSDNTASQYGYDLWNWSVHFDAPVK